MQLFYELWGIDMNHNALNFQKVDADGTVATCAIEIMEDGSVYVSGEQFGELIVEFASDALERAIAHVKAAGYEEA